MSNIVFSFDADAVGALAAIEALMAGFGGLVSSAENVVSSFASIASSTATMMSAWGSLLSNIGSMADGFDSASGSMGRAGGSARDLSYQLQQLGERAAEAAQKHAEAVQRIEEQEAHLTTRYEEEVARREASYNQSLERTVQQHQDALNSINDQETKLGESYLDQMDSRLKQLNDPRAIQHQTIVTAYETQIAAMISSGNQAGAAPLEAKLQAENTAYTAFLQKTIEPYYQYLDATGYRHHQEALQQLQDRLTKENRNYDEHTKDLKNNLDQQLGDLKTHYNDEMTMLQQHLNDENASYADQMRRIAEERQHLLTSGGGGGGGLGSTPFGLPPQASYLELFKSLGIDPKKDRIAAENALMGWITGGKFSFNGKTTDFGFGQDTNSQMTLDQIYTVVSQAIGFGQDPTRTMRSGGASGNENYLNLFSDLLAYSSALSPGQSDQQRFQSMTSIMRKVLEGNSNQIIKQLGTIGVTPEDLMKYGVNFKGKTIQNPQQVFDALMSYAYSKAGGLGAYQAHSTPMGVTNLIKDWWASIVIGVTGNINDPASLIAKFTKEYNRLAIFLFENRDKIIAFGKSVAEWLLGKFSQFIDYLNSKDFAKVLHNIGDAFRAIGDALHWMSQHKDILVLIGGLLTAQVGSKILGGLTGAPLQALFGGGMFGQVAGLFRQAPPTGAATTVFEDALGKHRAFGKMAGNAADHAKFLDDYAYQMMLMGIGGDPMAKKMIPGAINSADRANVKSTILEQMFASMGPAPTPPVGGPSMFGRMMSFMGGLPAWGQGVTRGAIAAPGNIASFARGAAGGVSSGFGTATSVVGGIASRGMGIAQGLAATFTGGGGGLGGLTALGGQGLSGIMSLGPMIMGLGPALMGLGPLLAGIGAAALPIIAVVGAIAGLVAVLVMNRDKIMPFINTLMHFFGEQLKQAEKAIMDFVHQIQDRLGPAFGPGSFVHNAILFFSRFWTGAWGGIKLIFSGVWDVIVGVIKIAWAIISNLILFVLDILSGKWGKAWKDIQNLFSGVWDGIKSILGGVLKIIVGTLLGFLGGLWSAVSGKAKDFSGGFIKFFMDLPGNIAKAWTNLTTSIGTFFSGLWNGVSKFATGFLTSFVGFFQGIPGTISGIFTKLPQTIANTFAGFTGFVIHALADHAGPLSGAILGLAKTLTIPGFARGGYYSANQLSVVGEEGPEMFLSGTSGTILNNRTVRSLLDKMGGGSFNFYGPVNLYGVIDPLNFYQQMNAMAGKKAEYGRRGGQPG